LKIITQTSIISILGKMLVAIRN